MSLSRLQLIVWTVIVLSAFGAAAIWNVHSPAATDPLKIDVAPQLWILIGIAATSAVAAPLVQQTTLNRPSIASRIEDGFLDATTLMEAFIFRGVPMRTAHEAVGHLVKQCETKKCRLIDLPIKEFEAVTPGGGSIRQSLGTANAIAAFRS